MNTNKTAKELEEEAHKLFKTYNFDSVVRTIAQSGEYDGTANWKKIFNGKTFCCTSGAGTNSASVYALQGKIYDNGDYGQYLKLFRPGTWVLEAVDFANKIHIENKKAEAEKGEYKEKDERAKWLPIDEVEETPDDN